MTENADRFFALRRRLRLAVFRRIRLTHVYCSSCSEEKDAHDLWQKSLCVLAKMLSVSPEAAKRSVEAHRAIVILPRGLPFAWNRHTSDIEERRVASSIVHGFGSRSFTVTCRLSSIIDTGRIVK